MTVPQAFIITFVLLYLYLVVLGILLYVCNLLLKEIYGILVVFGLQLSGYLLQQEGMRQRLGIAQAIMENPDILILDEPMNGLDNRGVEDVRKILLNLRDVGKSIILASHNKEDIEVLCDEVYEMDHGKFITTV